MQRIITMKIQDARKLKINSTFYIARDMFISEIAGKSSKAVKLLNMYGLHCTGCFLNAFDTLENGAKLHGLTDEDLDSMIEEINKELEKGQ